MACASLSWPRGWPNGACGRSAVTSTGRYKGCYRDATGTAHSPRPAALSRAQRPLRTLTLWVQLSLQKTALLRGPHSRYGCTTLPIRIDYTYDTHVLRHAPCLNWCRGPRQPGTDYRNCGRAGAIPLAGQFAQVAELNDRSACGWSTVLSGVRERTTSSTRSGWCRLATNSVPASAKHHASWTLIGAPEIGCQ